MSRPITGYDTALESPATVNGLAGESFQLKYEPLFDKRPCLLSDRGQNGTRLHSQKIWAWLILLSLAC